MTLIELLRFFRKHYPVVLLAAVLAGFAAALVSLWLKENFEATQTVYVKREASGQSSQFYAYDGYYAAQAAERFADSLFGALKSREVLRLSLSSSALGLSTKDLEKAVAAVKVKRLSPQLISFSYRDGRPETAKNLVNNLSQSTIDLAKRLNEGGDEKISLSLVSGEPLITVDRPSLVLNVTVGFLLGLFLSIAALALKCFFSSVPW